MNKYERKASPQFFTVSMDSIAPPVVCVLFGVLQQKFGPRKVTIQLRPGVDVVITIFCDFCQFSAKKMAFFSKTNVVIKILHNLALF
jgi:hypothetical protein